MDYYKILEVSENADILKIKKQYRKLAMKYHPDRNAGDERAAKKFREITEAYEVLSNEEKRKEYDYKRENENNHTKKKKMIRKILKINILKIILALEKSFLKAQPK